MANRRSYQALVLILLSAAFPAWAVNVQVMSLTDISAQVLVNGRTVHVLQIGERSQEGVKLVDIQDRIAVLQFNGQTHRMPVGGSPAGEALVRLGRDGGYRTTALLNRIEFPAIIDTGASLVALTSVHAKQLGIDYLNGRKGVAQTANGPVDAYLVNIPSIQVGGILLNDVVATVLVGSHTATMKEVLIGNSFLRQVNMQRSGDMLVLRR